MWKKKPLAHEEVRRDDRTFVYRLSGDLFGSESAYAFQDAVRETLSVPTRRVVLDLSGVEHIDSSGVGVLVTLMWSASQSGSVLALASLPATVERVLGIAMLLPHIAHASTTDEALVRLDATERSAE